MMRSLHVSAMLLATLSIAGAGKTNDDLLLEVDTQDLALFKLVDEIKAMNTTTAPSLSAYITEMLLPKADETKKFLQEKIDTSRANVVSCYRMVTGAGPDQDAANDDLNSNEGKQSACQKKDREDMTAEELICADFAASAMSFERNDAVKLQKVKHNLREFEKALYKYYDFYPRFMSQKNACWEATGEEHSQHAHCLFRMHYIEKAFCALRHNVTALCNEYSKCYKRNAEIMMDMEAKVRKLENHTQRVYKGLYCMAKNTGWEFATDVDHFITEMVDDAHLGCDKDSVDVSHLYISYPDGAPEKQACPNTEVQSASHLESSVKCADDPVPAPTEAAPTEAPATPSAGPGEYADPMTEPPAEYVAPAPATEPETEYAAVTEPPAEYAAPTEPPADAYR